MKSAMEFSRHPNVIVQEKGKEKLCFGNVKARCNLPSDVFGC